VYPPEEKSHTEKKPIEEMPPPTTVVIPLQQHIGAPSEPIVKQGDQVRIGDRLSEPQGFVSVPVHASVSGTVQKIAPLPHPLGDQMLAIVIENDGQDTVTDAIKPDENYLALTPDEMRQKIKEAGIAGMGGATFPTHVKLSPPESKPIDILILNGAECEPYLCADNRVMIERPREVVLGLRLLMRAVGAKQGIVAVEANKPQAIEVLQREVQKVPGLRLVVLKVKYPQGAEKQLIYATTRRQVPSGGLPMDVGVCVSNVGTAVAVTEAVIQGKPLVERVVTVSGAVAEPANLLVRIGTPLGDLIDLCGGFSQRPHKVIMGGPMMGLAQATLQAPVVKGTSGLVVQGADEASADEPLHCIRCGRCVRACPMGLTPSLLGLMVQRDRIVKARDNHLLDCMECGCCAYVCPAKIPLVHLFKYAKARLRKMKEAKRGA